MTDDDQDEWLDYASAGYGGAIDPWEDLVPIDESEESDIELDDEMISRMILHRVIWKHHRALLLWEFVT